MSIDVPTNNIRECYYTSKINKYYEISLNKNEVILLSHMYMTVFVNNLDLIVSMHANQDYGRFEYID